jgi:hypothetical protein
MYINIRVYICMQDMLSSINTNMMSLLARLSLYLALSLLASCEILSLLVS